MESGALRQLLKPSGAAINIAVAAGVVGSPSSSKAGEEELRSDFLRADCTETGCGRLSCKVCGVLALSPSKLGVTAACVPNIAGLGLSQAAVFGLRLGTG